VLVRKLRELGAKVVIHDPYVPPYQGDLRERLRGCDAAVLMVAHDEYRHLNPAELDVPVVVDGRRVLEESDNYWVVVLGRGIGGDKSGIGSGFRGG